MKRSLVVLIAFAVFAPPVHGPSARAAVGQDWVKIRTGQWRIPFGNSTSKQFVLNTKTPTSQLKVGYEGAYCSTVQVRYIEVTYDLGVVDRIMVNAKGIFELDPNERLRGIKIFNYQGVYKHVSCEENIYLAEGTVVEEEDFEYLGSFRYDGGQTTSQVTAKTVDRITHFWVEIPAYCEKLKVKNAGTVTEGIFDAAKKIEENVYEVNGGAGSRISAIQLQLKGPTGLSCDIALYVRKK